MRARAHTAAPDCSLLSESGRAGPVLPTARSVRVPVSEARARPTRASPRTPSERVVEAYFPGGRRRAVGARAVFRGRRSDGGGSADGEEPAGCEAVCATRKVGGGARRPGLGVRFGPWLADDSDAGNGDASVGAPPGGVGWSKGWDLRATASEARAGGMASKLDNGRCCFGPCRNGGFGLGAQDGP